MTNPNPKRFRTRFSIRTLAILVTLACCYAACWGPTKRQGVQEVKSYAPPIATGERRTQFTRPVAPLLIAVDNSGTERQCRRYYIWFFGCIAELPYERDFKPPYFPPSLGYRDQN